VRHRLETFLNGVWYRNQQAWLPVLLAPIEQLYGYLARARWAKQASVRCNVLPCPVVVVGNIVAGGSGKTPVTQALALALQAKGLRVGIVSRGYGGTNIQANVVDHSQPQRFGDEPCLLAATTHSPVVVAYQRRDAVLLLCQRYSIDIVLSDDGMQHASLHRDFELCVVGSQGFGNKRCLPAGPLREPLERLQAVNAILSGSSSASTLERLPLQSVVPSWSLVGEQGALQYLDGSPAPEGTLNHLSCLQATQHLKVYAAAGLAQPERFYHGLSAAGLFFQILTVSDHGRLSTRQMLSITPEAVLLITEKDAVKLRHQRDIPLDLLPRIRVVPWRIILPSALVDSIADLVIHKI
jgi:tetraacyldisaccharide 4'-kinase